MLSAKYSRDDLSSVPIVGVDCTGDPDIVDHASADSADLNVLMRRFIQYGTAAPVSGRTPQFGEQDLDFDLAAGLEAKRAVRDAYLSLPDFAKERYGSPDAFLAACADGSVDLSDPNPKRRASDVSRDRRASDKESADAVRFKEAIAAAVAAQKS